MIFFPQFEQIQYIFKSSLISIFNLLLFQNFQIILFNVFNSPKNASFDVNVYLSFRYLIVYFSDKLLFIVLIQIFFNYSLNV